jgi:ATP-dependent RNA helicase DeaD
MQGCDVIGQSQTGSGKTAAFCIPAIERVDPLQPRTQILILAPTRELATQVANEVHKLAAFKKAVRSVPIYGGAPYERQFAELQRGAHIVVGTPGRLADHMARGTLDLSHVTMLILDEADRMLDMGFRDDIEKLLAAAPTERQTVFFSATISPQIQTLVREYSRDAKTVRIEQKTVGGAPLVDQVYYEVRHHAKLDALSRLIDFYAVKSGVIFCNTQRMVDELADALVARGCAAERLHGGLAQAQRTRVMTNFKKAAFQFLVATDVAARGIDVHDLELVVNYDLPYDAEDYVHRIGRTGRAGRKGRAVTLVSGAGIYKLQAIERVTKARIRREHVPTIEAVESRWKRPSFPGRGSSWSGCWRRATRPRTSRRPSCITSPPRPRRSPSLWSPGNRPSSSATASAAEAARSSASMAASGRPSGV